RSCAQWTVRSRWFAWSHSGGVRSTAIHAAAATTITTATRATAALGRPRRARWTARLSARVSGQERAKASQAFADPLDGGSIGEAEIALGVAPEGDAWGEGHVTALQDLGGEDTRVGRQVPSIGKDVKGTHWLDGDAETEGSHPVDHDPPPLVEDGPVARGLLAGLAQGGHSRPLHELVGRDEEIAKEGDEGPDHLARSDHVTETPARHGEGLGEAVEHDRLVGELEHRVVAPCVVQTVVDLVRHEGNAELGEGRQLGCGQD